VSRKEGKKKLSVWSASVSPGVAAPIVIKSASPLINSSLSREFDLQLVPTVVQQLTRYFDPHISYTGSVVRPVAVAELLVFYYSSIVTISLSCTFSEILALIPPPIFRGDIWP